LLLHDLFKFLGINKFEKILVESVDMQSVGKEEAIKEDIEATDRIVGKLSRNVLSKV
jgi:FMN-dependent NADH-azoreductase